MFKRPVIEIGIIGTETGKQIIKKVLVDHSIYKDERELFTKKAIDTLKKVSKWFDKRDTFFSGKPIWEHWVSVGSEIKFINIIKSSSLGSIACEEIVVFDENGKGGSCEIYVKRVID